MTGKNNTDSSWVSFSDIMTGLMVIFLFISVSYIVEVQKKQKERDIIFKEFKNTKEKLYAELDSIFKDDFTQWQVVLDKDLSIKFTNPDVLFEAGKDLIRPNFERILDDFLPRYFDILLQPKYRNNILEIRIEGHTDTTPAPQIDTDPYIANVKLSQRRSTAVLRYFRNTQYYQSIPDSTEKILQYWLTANGLSYGRTVDNNGELTMLSKNKTNNELSRRVEFRIVTSSEGVIEKYMKDISNE
jgi:outer membrane protein OmpA-like peptidoglycan-associated protein